MNSSTEITVQYGSGVVTLPLEALKASAGHPEELQALACLLASVNREDPFRAAAELAGKPEEEIRRLCGYYRTLGILSFHDSEGETGTAASADTGVPAAAGLAAAPRTEEKPGKVRSSTLPLYTPEMAAQAIEQNSSLRDTLDECARILGKILTEQETERLCALYDAYGLESDYIVTLCGWCAKQGKTTVSYVVKTALGMQDDGITTFDELNAHITALEQRHQLENRIRRLFGIGDRAFSRQEKQYLDAWTEYGMSPEMIEYAWELTVGAMPQPKMPYTNKIIEEWHTGGITDPDTARRKHEEHQALLGQTAQRSSAPVREKPQAETAATAGQSFDLDAFVAAAIANSK